jgi:heme o synthase
MELMVGGWGMGMGDGLRPPLPLGELRRVMIDAPPSSTGVLPLPLRLRLRAYYELTKPGIAFFVMMTAGVCFIVAMEGRPGWLPLIHTLIGIGLATGGALALNQYLERDVDARMRRTQSRPLPSRRLHPAQALAFGLVLVGVGVLHLALTVGPLPALLTLGSGAAYTLAYTPLKPRSYLATFVGAIPGAMPAFIGWSAATGTLTFGAFVLFVMAFLWQLPHVLALAWVLREDYERAGFLLAPMDPDGKRLGTQLVVWTAVLLVVSTVPTLIGLAGLLYLAGAVFLGLVLLSWSLAARVEMNRDRVRKVFLGSLGYQPLLLGVLLLDVWLSR